MAPTLLLRAVIPIIATIMLIQTANSLRVAVLGSGIAGSTVARTLADRGIEVTVFEGGFGVGGRTSTRITRDDDRYQFDHGAQYIGAPKTDAFRDAVRKWEKDGWVKEWSGRFVTADSAGLHDDDEKKVRYVGYPGMHSICQNLLQHGNIRVELQTQARASRSSENWDMVHGKSKKDLGSFDWLIASDRNSANHHRKDLSSANVDEFTLNVRKDIKSVKSLTAMVAFEKSLGLGMDGVQFAEPGTKFGSLAWAARDTSKPGRERKDGRECWVLQSRPDAATELLKGKKDVGEIRDMAKEVLVADFLKSAPLLLAGDGNCDDMDFDLELPSVATAMGHRWGAAFPIPSEKYQGMESQLILEKNFVACGDYFGALSGRIEGAYLSGLSAANQLCDGIDHR